MSVGHKFNKPNGYCSVFLLLAFFAISCYYHALLQLFPLIFTCLHSIGWMVYLLLLELCLLSLLCSLPSLTHPLFSSGFYFHLLFSLHQTPGTSLIPKGSIAGLQAICISFENDRMIEYKSNILWRNSEHIWLVIIHIPALAHCCTNFLDVHS